MTMPTDAALVDLCAQIYQPDAIVSGFDHFDAGMDDGVCWALKRLQGFDVVIFRGSITLQDWLRDIDAIALPTRIGHAHAGFFDGMERAWSEARPMLRQPCIVTGHSLGAAHADILTALMTVDGVVPTSRVVFGEPKPGFLDLAMTIKDVPGRSYRNGDALHHDLVTDVPFSFPPEEYVHPTPVIPVCAEPKADLFDRWGVFAYHHIQLYQAAIAAFQPQERVA